jgi:hypothetical protein
MDRVCYITVTNIPKNIKNVTFFLKKKTAQENRKNKRFTPLHDITIDRFLEFVDLFSKRIMVF